MERLRILHFADAHLDDKNFEEKKACMLKIVNTAHGQRPDLVVFAGDAFNSRDVRAESRAAKLFFSTIRDLSVIAPVIVLSGTASHDGGAPMLLDHFHEDSRVMVSNYPEQIFFSEGELVRDYPVQISEGWLSKNVDAVISMVPPPTKQFFNIDGNLSIDNTNQAIGQAMSTLFRGFAASAVDYDCPHILVGHFNVAGSMISPTQILIGKDIEVSRGQLDEANADLVCLGHIHKAQQIGDNIFYPGSTQTNTWGELDDKGFYVHDLVPGATRWALASSEFILTPSRKRIWIKYDMTVDDPREFDTTLYAYDQSELKNSVVRIDIKTWKDQQHNINVKDVAGFFESAGASEVAVNVTAIARETVRAEAVSRAVTLWDKIQAMAESRGEKIASGIKEKVIELETGDPAIMVSKWTAYFSNIEKQAEMLIEYNPVGEVAV